MNEGKSSFSNCFIEDCCREGFAIRGWHEKCYFLHSTKESNEILSAASSHFAFIIILAQFLSLQFCFVPQSFYCCFSRRRRRKASKP